MCVCVCVCACVLGDVVRVGSTGGPHKGGPIPAGLSVLTVHIQALYQELEQFSIHVSNLE